RSPDPRYFVGSGKAEEIRERAEALSADVILFDHPLSPSQERNLEKLTGRRVLDRAGLILDIFAQRARSAEGKLEVELAQLKHLSTRLVRGWTHLERQKGGIGLRGPGETQLETDRRLLAKRIKTLSERLEKLAQQRDTGRSVRKKVPVPSIALVGYTNAGKSTLFGALSGSQVYVADQLFATLDPTVRRLQLPHTQELVVADTVGFIRDLPHELVAAFRSTLLEARDADLLVHVIDASDPERAERTAQVNDVLASIGAGDIPQLQVFNKIDRLEESPRVEHGEEGRPTRVWLSARSGAGVDLLKECLHERFGRVPARFRLALAPSAGRARARLHALHVVCAESSAADGGWLTEVEMPVGELEDLCQREGLDFQHCVSPCTVPIDVESRPAAVA
ncbi:MAG: GTPase HflX, partial [Steroidobacteraceae bacterium]|nr:GTPase HflX [Steroidobacteraceae bacterium]